MSQIKPEEFTTAHVEPTSDDDVSDEGDQEVSSGAAESGDKRYETLERLKREKRLAMNRECARARRRRKKLRMELLDNRVQELTQKNNRIQEENLTLRARVMQLEAELGAAKSNMGLDVSSRMGGPGGMVSSAGYSPGFSSDLMSSQALIAEKLHLQRRAALAGLGGSSTVAPAPGFGGLMGSIGGNADQGSALRYMQQIMQTKGAVGGSSDQNKPLFGGSPFSPTGLSMNASADQLH